jgi:hypothetical protein
MQRKILFMLLLGFCGLSGLKAQTLPIHITFPAEGDTLYRDSTYNITWTADSNAPTTMQLQFVYDSGRLVAFHPLGGGIPTADGTFPFKVDSNESYSSLFFLRALTDEFDGDPLSERVDITIAPVPKMSGIREENAPSATLSPVIFRDNSLKLAYSLDQPGPVRLSIYDLNGRLIYDRASGMQSAGQYENTVSTAGALPGIYICRLQAGSECLYQKLSLVR